MLKSINLKKLTANSLIGLLLSVGLVAESSKNKALANSCNNNGHGNNAPMTVSLPSGEITIGHFDPSNPSNAQKNRLIDDLNDGNFGNDIDKRANYYISFTGSSYNLSNAEATELVNSLPDWEMTGNGTNTILNCEGNDYDNDGINDAVELGSNFNSPLDTDGDGVPDFLDNDGASSATQSGNPNSNWSANNTMNDCYGTSYYGSSNNSCQNYQGDLYENWNPNDSGHGDTDIKTYSVGADNNYFYFEIDLRKDWNYDDGGESRKYYLEIEADGDGQSDYFLVYQPKEEDLNSSWNNKGGSGEVEVYEDKNNSIGGNNPNGADSGDSDGYESDLSSGKNLSSGDFYVRRVNGNIQIALKKSTIGSPTNILSRAYASQNTNLSPDKLTWHDRNTISDFDGAGGFDSSAGADISTWLAYPTSTNSAPVTGKDTAQTYVRQTVTVDVLNNDSDPDSDTLYVTQVSDPLSNDPNNTDVGTAGIDANGNIVYLAGDKGGVYTIEYTVSDSGGKTSTGTLEITVVNRVPTVGNDTATVYANRSVTVNVLENDSDPDISVSDTNQITDILSITKFDGYDIVDGDNTVAGGTASIDADGNIVYKAGRTRGTYTIEYTVSDKGGATNTGTLTITVILIPD